MESTVQRLTIVRQRIRDAESRFDRAPGSVKLLAVSKSATASQILEAIDAGQKAFGESYLQEALEKMRRLQAHDVEWHFIGRIQSNKTRSVAEEFTWVHSLTDMRHARRLSAQRPVVLPPLKVCLQVNISGEPSKAGVPPGQLEELISRCAELPGLELRGLMTLPAFADGFAAQRMAFRRLRELRDRLARPGLRLETLSMGMSGDLEAAIAEGATIVRIGTAVFGARPSGSKT